VKRISAIVFGIILCGLLLPAAQASDVTHVTSGVFTFESVGNIDLSGQSGLHLTSTVSSAAGHFAPENQCDALDCVPGTVMSLNAGWSSPDLGGQLSLRGKDYALGVEGEGGAGGSVEFDGRVTLPDFNGSDTIDVSAPFTLSGGLHYPDVIDGTDTSLSGQGTATLTMRVSPDGTAWQFVSARYEFAKK
jgi:hypothetical protein